MKKRSFFIQIAMVAMGVGVLCMSYFLRVPVQLIPGLGPRIIDFQEDKAVRWELHSPQMKIICQKESNGSFMLLLPEPKRVINSSEFLANVKNFNTMEYLHIVQKDVEDPSNWGVDGERVYKLFLQNPQKVYEFQIGSFVKSFRGYYLYYNATIYSVPSWVVEAIEKNPQELRQGYFLQKEVEQVISLRIFFQNQLSIFVKKEGLYWKVNGFSKEFLNISNVDGLVQDIFYAKSEAIFCQQDEKFSQLWEEFQSVNGQSVTAVVVCSDGTKIKFTLFKKGEQLYGVREDKKDIEVLPLSLYESLSKPMEFYLKT